MTPPNFDCRLVVDACDKRRVDQVHGSVRDLIQEGSALAVIGAGALRQVLKMIFGIVGGYDPTERARLRCLGLHAFRNGVSVVE